jgi:4-hydroxysphinganine ceramide fatty acyl 2-hydroxylase
MSKRIHIYTAEDVATHSKASSCWVSRAGKVYDVTGFLDDHPGGDDLILQHGGKDIEEAMKDKLEHNHSDSAYNLLEGLIIGRLGTGEAVVREGSFFLLLFAPRHHFLPGRNRLGGLG